MSSIKESLKRGRETMMKATQGGEVEIGKDLTVEENTGAKTTIEGDMIRRVQTNWTLISDEIGHWGSVGTGDIMR